MIRLIRGPWSRGASLALCGVLVVPLLLMAAPEVRAQSVHSTRQLRVVVLNIDDITRRAAGEEPNEALRRTTLDAIWTELHANPHFLPVPERDLQVELENLGLAPPYTPQQQVRLAQALTADAILVGYVVNHGIATKGDLRQAQVSVQVLLRDIQTGEFVNGRTVKQMGSRLVPGDTRTDQALIDEAAELAAGAAVTEMSRYQIPQGAVIGVRGPNNILINIGSRDGVEEGMVFALLRKVTDRSTGRMTLEVRGHISADEIMADQTRCKQGRDAQTVEPEDIIRALWMEEPLKITQEIEQVQAAKGGDDDDDDHDIAKVLLGIALVAAVVVLTVRAVGGGVGQAGLRGSRVAPPTLNMPLARTADAMGTELGNGKREPAISVTWPTPSAPSVEPSRTEPYLVGYEIHRSTKPAFKPSAETLQAVIPDGRCAEYVDRGEATEARSLTLDLAGDTGMVAVAETKATGPARMALEEGTFSYTWTHRPLEPGVQYYYVVRAITKGVAFGPATGPVGLGAMRLYDIGPATAMGHPRALSTRGMAGELANRIFEFEASAGADTYVIQISDRPSFAAERTLTSAPMAIDAAPGQVVSRPFAGPDVQGSFGDGTELYWRVGAARSGDQAAQAIKGGGFVFSAARLLAG